MIVYLHGGAFVFGSIRSHASLVSHFSKKLQTKILFIEYALDPENIALVAFPPVLIMASTNEILLDDSKNFYNSIKDKQENTTLTIYESQTHVWLLSEMNMEASQRALSEIEEFLNG